MDKEKEKELLSSIKMIIYDNCSWWRDYNDDTQRTEKQIFSSIDEAANLILKCIKEENNV
jgi:hypothetical protein